MLNHLETSTMTRNPNTSSLADTEDRKSVV